MLITKSNFNICFFKQKNNGKEISDREVSLSTGMLKVVQGMFLFLSRDKKLDGLQIFCLAWASIIVEWASNKIAKI